MTIPVGPLRALPSSAITARAEPFWAARGVGRGWLIWIDLVGSLTVG
jgi:hypothetical protein